MTLQKWGGTSALILALTYIFGFVLFFVVLDTSAVNTPEQHLAFFIDNRDTYFLAYLIIGVLFSLALLILVQAIHERFKTSAPQIAKYTSTVGNIWSMLVLASSFVFLTSIEAIAKYHLTSPEQALAIYRSTNIVVDALGGGIELIGAIWVLAISYVGLKYKVLNALLHYWGLLVSAAGILTLFSGFTLLSENSFFEITTAIFGLGQIPWFIALGIALCRDKEDTHDLLVVNR